jgi:hypothetical protein
MLVNIGQHKLGVVEEGSSETALPEGLPRKYIRD